jgi:proliferating cell nuclear antigen
MNDDYILELKTVQTNVFKTLTEALKEILTEANFEFFVGDSKNENDEKKGYVKVVSMDPSQTALVHLRLEGKHCERYYCKKRTIVGVSMINFHKLIKTLTNNDTLTLYIKESDPSKLRIKLENVEKQQTCSYTLNLMDLNNQEVKIPNQTFEQYITMPSSDFQKICRDMSNLTDVLEIRYIKNQLIFKGDGDFADSEIVISENANGEIKFSGISNLNGIIQGYYNLKHLCLFTKCTNLSPNVTLFMKNDFPLIISYQVGSLGVLKLAIAPKVKE